MSSSSSSVAVGPRLRALFVSLGVAFVGLAVGVGLVIGTSLGLRVAGLSVGTVGLIVLSLVLVQGVAFGAVGLAYLRWRDLEPSFVPVRAPTFRDVLWIASGYVLALSAAFVGALLVTLTGLQAAPNQAGTIGAENPVVLLALIPLSLLLIGPGEELLFRGLVQGTIRESFGPVTSVVLASAIFASIHYVALSGGAGARLVTIGVLFLPSLVFGATYELTDNLTVPAAIHGAYNATLFSLLYLAVRFADAGAPA